MKINITDTYTKRSGIYIIKVLGGSSVYIGSAVDLSNRISRHKRDLEKGKHHCNPLLRAVQKYGMGAVTVELLEFCDRGILLEREKFWFGNFPRLYNCAKEPGSTRGVFPDDETREKIGYFGFLTRTSTGFRGVTKVGNYYHASFNRKGITRSLGSFRTSEEASLAFENYVKNPDKYIQKKLNNNNTSGYEGVVSKKNGTWQASANIVTDGAKKRVSIGYFLTAKEASEARERFLKTGVKPTIKCKPSSSGIKGVYWNKRAQKWQVQINIAGKNKTVGTFTNLVDAYAGKLNFIKEHSC